ncbi:hypothetical protein MH122_13855 [Bacillus pumilus]|uniref:hypothetical protein n=1 Tax=Bacillus pumilus TaxID=1408 RepID=UPI002281A226|nr:hypothetical protein [Bacillus pumilus]MCY7679883.1 hypothetical protein [Bacillus pumilus]
MSVQMITMWYKYNDKDEEPKFNHIEFGHVSGEYPKPKHPSYSNQKAWKKSDWERKYAILDGNYKIVEPVAFWME